MSSIISTPQLLSLRRRWRSPRGAGRKSRQARKHQQYEHRKPEIEPALATAFCVVTRKADRRKSATTSPSAWSKWRQALKKL